MIKFNVERYSAAIEEIKPLLPAHAKELAAHKHLPIDPNFELYAQSDADGLLHLVTARVDAGALVGYHASFIVEHPHYKSMVTAYADLYYLLPEYRKGWDGVKFLKFVDSSLADRGVQRVFTTTTVDSDKSAVLRRLGHRECERMYVKMLGEKS